MAPKQGFLDLFRNFVISFSWKQSKIKTNIVIDISVPVPYLLKCWLSSYGLKCCQPIKLQYSLKYIILRKWNDEVYFGHTAKHQSLLQVDTIILQYLQKSMGRKLIFCQQIKTKVFYKVIVLLWVCVFSHAQSTQNNKFAISLNFSRKTERIKLIFCLQINVKGAFKLILSFQVCVARHAQITPKIKFAISLQYLKKEVIDEVDFFTCR